MKAVDMLVSSYSLCLYQFPALEMQVKYLSTWKGSLAQEKVSVVENWISTTQSLE